MPEPIRRDLKKLPRRVRQFLKAMCRVTAKNMPLPGLTEDQQVEGFMELLENGFMRFASHGGDIDDQVWIEMLDGWDENGNEIWISFGPAVMSEGQTLN